MIQFAGITFSKLLKPGVGHCAVWLNLPNVSQEPTASTLKTEAAGTRQHTPGQVHPRALIMRT
jgi:hypothetical protein